MRECNTAAEGGVVLEGSSSHPMISAIRARAVIAASLVAALFGASCDSGETAPQDDDAMHIVLTEPDLILAIGASGSVHVTVVRNAFEGLVRLRTEGVPSGVTVPEVIVAGNEFEGTLVFTATA